MLEKVELNKKTVDVRGVVSSVKSAKNINVKFKKKDGTDRVMNCTLNFDKIPKEHYPKGISSTAEAKPVDELTEYLKVYDREKRGWRSIPLFRLDWINIDGEEYAIEYEEST